MPRASLGEGSAVSISYIQAVDLKEHLPCYSPELTFLRAEMSTRHLLPLALIRYALYGQEQEHGLRLDLEKQVFLDAIPEHDEMEGILQKAASEIAQYLGSLASRIL